MKKLFSTILAALVLGVTGVAMTHSNPVLSTYAEGNLTNVSETEAGINNWGFDICENATGTVTLGENLVFNVNASTSNRADWHVKLFKNIPAREGVTAYSVRIRFMTTAAGNVTYNLTNNWSQEWVNANTEITKVVGGLVTDNSFNIEFQFGLLGNELDAFTVTIYEVSIFELEDSESPLSYGTSFELRNRTNDGGHVIEGHVDTKDVSNGAKFVTTNIGSGGQENWRYEMFVKTTTTPEVNHLYMMEYSVNTSMEVPPNSDFNIVLAGANADGWYDKYEVNNHGDYNLAFAAGETKTFRKFFLGVDLALKNNLGVMVQAGKMPNLGTVTISDVKIYQLIDEVNFQMESADHFVNTWRGLRDGATNGLCDYLVSENRATLENLIKRYDTLLVTTNGFIGENQKDKATNAIDVEGVTVGTSVNYFRGVLDGSIPTSGNYDIASNTNNLLEVNQSVNTPILLIVCIASIIGVTAIVVFKRKHK